MMDIAHLRRESTQAGLSRQNLADNPWVQFEQWFQQAIEVEVLEPNAMSLATVSKEGIPALRTVLLKSFDTRGFVFFTNYQSQKAKEMAENPNVALLFPWIALHRQVKIKGRADKISQAESLKYFMTRPRGSQLGAWVSRQSSVISSRALLEQKMDEMKRKFTQGQIPLPDFWGGYRVVPTSFEFWQGREKRLHDRFRYQWQGQNNPWRIERLAP